MDENVGLDDLQIEAEKETFPIDSENGEQAAEVENALDAQVLREIREEVGRRFQSAKDKRWSQLEKQYGALSDLQAKTETGEKSLNEAVNAEKLLENLKGLVDDMGLGEDAEVIELLQDKRADTDLESYFDLMNTLTLTVLEKAKATPASAGSVIQPGGGIAPMEGLQQVYDRAKKKIRPGDVNALMTLKRNFRGKGLDVF